MTDFEWPEERAGLQRATARWWLYLLLGAASVAVGILLLLDLFAAVRTVALMAALGLVLTGVSELTATGRYRSVLGIVAGVFLIVGGVAAAVWPGITLWVLAVVVGIGLVVSGVARIMGALALRIEGWGLLLTGGIVSVVVGIMALVWPEATILALGILLGVRMVIFGVSEIMFSVALHAGRTIR